jgi:undecaprenyl-diphosphatase
VNPAYASPALSPLVALLLGIVEGLTEYLPISSTGHLILVGEWLGATDEASKSFDIVIQFGAILAVVVHYRRLLAERARGLLRLDPKAVRLLVALFVAFLPAAVAGLGLHQAIKRHLFGPLPVAAALLLGGILMVVVERVRARVHATGIDRLDAVTPTRALVIGLGQCCSLWPGASRSMCTIVAGQLAGLSTRTAAEFSFLLALPTLGAATLYEGYRARQEFGSALTATPLWIGLGVSFLVAWAVIAAFVRYLGRRGLEPFGYYRIGLGLLVIWLVR